MTFEELDLKKEEFNKIHLVGINNTLFLNIDSNYELKQHYSEDFENKFNPDKFKESYYSKKKYCEERGIEYKFYVVPDKSIVCKDLLPITPKITKRNYYAISDLVFDFIDVLDSNDYFKTDSHINNIGGIKYSAEILHDLDDSVSSQMYLEAIKENMFCYKIYYGGDLYEFKNPEVTKKEIIDSYQLIFPETSAYDYPDDDMNIPEEFAKVGTRDSVYLKNRFSLTDKKCLIFRDSTGSRFIKPLSIYFNKIFAYWDHWFFNTDLIEWYKPDVIMEIRTERFLERMKYEIIK